MCARVAQAVMESGDVEQAEAAGADAGRGEEARRCGGGADAGERRRGDGAGRRRCWRGRWARVCVADAGKTRRRRSSGSRGAAIAGGGRREEPQAVMEQVAGICAEGESERGSSCLNLGVPTP